MVATIIPFGSEVYFITLLSLEKYNHFILFLVVSVGNVLGSLFNWICGFYINFFIKKSWFPINNKIIDRGNKLFIKYGKWSLLISWFPLIGDPITFAAGTLRYPIIPFLVLVSIGKVGRYLIIYLSIIWAFNIF
ncbi:DedA family protein [Alphaproteobacteria bacterium]|jgi:membrane protein YqaA with SNARE-associated domain|nr:DedA family protein [Alphaproteobacteria bacterium]